MTKPSPARYRTTNWPSYNAALKKRGSLLIWLDNEMTWLAPMRAALAVRQSSPMPQSNFA